MVYYLIFPPLKYILYFVLSVIPTPLFHMLCVLFLTKFACMRKDPTHSAVFVL